MPHHGGMARGGPDDIENLLREVENTVGDRGHRPAKRGGFPPGTAGRDRRRGRGVVDIAVVSGAVAAAVVFVLFALVPFLGAFSGAAGAFLGVFVTVLIGRFRRRPRT